MQLSIQINNLKKTQQQLAAIKDGLQTGMSPALEIIGREGSKYFGGVAFQSKGSAFGKPWEPLKDSTDRDKAKHWPGRPDMVRTGDMENRFDYEVKGSASVYLSNDTPYFKYHQSTEEHHKVPRRVMIGVNQSFKRLIRTAIKTQTRTIIREATR